MWERKCQSLAPDFCDPCENTAEKNVRKIQRASGRVDDVFNTRRRQNWKKRKKKNTNIKRRRRRIQNAKINILRFESFVWKGTTSVSMCWKQNMWFLSGNVCIMSRLLLYPGPTPRLNVPDILLLSWTYLTPMILFTWKANSGKCSDPIFLVWKRLLRALYFELTTLIGSKLLSDTWLMRNICKTFPQPP